MSESRKWVAESKTGKFIIERMDNRGLMTVDCARLDPDDEDSIEGMISIMPEDPDEFLAVMRKAVEMDLRE
jgi:hypothetical protein